MPATQDAGDSGSGCRRHIGSTFSTCSTNIQHEQVVESIQDAGDTSAPPSAPAPPTFNMSRLWSRFRSHELLRDPLSRDPRLHQLAKVEIRAGLV
jgi:hypothetical protein